MKKYVYLGIILMAVMMTSCINTKKMIVLEDMKEGNLYPMNNQQDIKIQRDDQLSIVINSKNKELTAPFNMNGGSFHVAESGDVATTGNSQRRSEGYTVDYKGDIELPILGPLHAEGMTCQELTNTIKERLITDSLVSDPLVLVDILNLKISLMGEVNRIGVINVTDKRITLLEALTRAGGLTANANPKKVVVIREEGDARKMYIHDIRSTEIFDSPCYYLQQNDIVYVRPQFAKSNTREERTLRFYSLGVGVISFITSLFILLK